MITKDQIDAYLNLIAAGKIEKVAKELLFAFKTNANEQERYAELVQFNSNYEKNKRKELIGTLSASDFNVISTRYTAYLIEFLTELKKELNTIKFAKPPEKTGGKDSFNLNPVESYPEAAGAEPDDILEKININATDFTTKNVVATVIPPLMEINKDFECKVLIAPSKDLIEKMVNKTETLTYDYDVELTKITEVTFKVKGTDVSAFLIVPQHAHSTQALQTGRATEWIWAVQPQKLGNFTFLIFVSAVFRVNGIDYPQDIKLEKAVEVKTIPKSVENASNSGEKREKNAKTNVLNILFFSANAEEDARLNIGKEFDEITSEISKATYRDNLKIITPKLSASVKDLLAGIIKEDPTILHFAGHGSENGITLVNADGSGQLVSNLIELLAQAEGLECLILNACYSAVQATAIKARLPNLHIIGMKYPVGDSNASIFSAGFYMALGVGRSYKKAFDAAKALVSASNADDEVLVFL